MELRKLAAAAALIAGSQGALAQEQGDPQRGLSYAEKTCTECHSVRADDPEGSPNPDAPTFKEVANTPGMTETALAVWFQSPHPSMPNFIIPPEDIANVVAYIVSLKGKK